MKATKSVRKFRVEGDVVWLSLTQGKETCIDFDDWPLVWGFTWFAVKTCDQNFYAQTQITRNGVRSLIYLNWLLMGGKADHKDGDGLNNRRSNLRSVTHSQNMKNRRKHKNNSSGFTGVTADGNRWLARLWADGKQIYVGWYKTKEAAAHARDKAARKHHKEFARLNFSV